MAFVPDTAVLLAYSLACLVLFITPGPDMSLFLAKTLSGGRKGRHRGHDGRHARLRRAFAAGCLRPLGADRGLADRSSWSSRSWARSISSGWPSTPSATARLSTSRPPSPTHAPFWRTLALGLSINLTNPKVVLFFVTFLPQFVDAHDPQRAGKLLFLGIYFVVLTSPLARAADPGRRATAAWPAAQPARVARHRLGVCGGIRRLCRAHPGRRSRADMPVGRLIPADVLAPQAAMQKANPARSRARRRSPSSSSSCCSTSSRSASSSRCCRSWSRA